MKYLIAGLGNPGEKYVNTRHNIGFRAVETLVAALGGTFVPSNFGDMAEVKTRGRQLIVIKPNTYMNLSGNALRFWLQKEHIPLNKLLVISDDINLDFGILRIRGKGSDGGHNGLKDIIARLNTTQFCRLRLGVGNEFARGRLVDYVLGEWDHVEQEGLPEFLKKAAEAAVSFCTIGLSHTMNKFNS